MTYFVARIPRNLENFMRSLLREIAACSEPVHAIHTNTKKYMDIKYKLNRMQVISHQHDITPGHTYKHDVIKKNNSLPMCIT